MAELEGKVALVTGASRGIGAATAVALAEAGAEVILTGRNLEALKAVEGRIRETGGNCTTLPLELADVEAITQLAQDIAARWERLDIVVHSAAVLPAATPVATMLPEIFGEALEVNVRASHALLHATDPLLRKSAHGRIVLLTSPASKFTIPEWSGYSATKAAQEMLFECYAKEVAESTDIRLALVNPGAVRTEMRAKAFPEEDPQTVKPPEEVAAHILQLLCDDFETLDASSVEDWAA